MRKREKRCHEVKAGNRFSFYDAGILNKRRQIVLLAKCLIIFLRLFGRKIEVMLQFF